jgi:hypothetical protein
MCDSQIDLAALVYENHQDPDEVLDSFAIGLRTGGYRVAGLVQIPSCANGLLSVKIIHTGETVPLLENRGPEAKGCKLDVAQLLHAGAKVAAAIDEGVDLLIINRFGKQEQEGKGLVYLIEKAVGEKVPVIVAMRSDVFPQWVKFENGMSVKIECSNAALNAWWGNVSQRVQGRSGAAFLKHT